MCNVAVKKQHYDSLKFAFLEKETKKKKLNLVLKTFLFMLFGKKHYCPLAKNHKGQNSKEELVIIF
jgi:hypothetical protein